MKAVLIALVVALVVLVINGQTDKCPTSGCHSQAGCATGECPCYKDNREYSPPRYPLASSIPGCPDCAPIKGTDCYSARSRFACYQRECTDEQQQIFSLVPQYS